jgi:hypothetical protein
MDWNEERTATLRKLWLEGMSASQVARQLGGVSRSAVIGKVHRLGITVRDIPARQRTAVRTAVRDPLLPLADRQSRFPRLRLLRPRKDRSRIVL